MIKKVLPEFIRKGDRIRIWGVELTVGHIEKVHHRYYRCIANGAEINLPVYMRFEVCYNGKNTN